MDQPENPTPPEQHEEEAPKPGRRVSRVGRKPGFKGTSNRTIEYKCADCGAEPGRENMVAVRIQFTTVGKPQKLIRSRTIKWVCRPCMLKSPEYEQEAFLGAPGMQDVIGREPSD